MPGDPEETNIKLAGMKVTWRIGTLSELASRRPSEIGHSAGWNAGDPEEQDIQLAVMKETQKNRTFSRLERRRPRGTGIQLFGIQKTQR